MKKILYKYRAINDNTLDIIVNNKMWYASISSLNDPNEGLIEEFAYEKAKKFIRKTKENQLSGFLMSMAMSMNSSGLFFGMNNRELKRFQKSIKSKENFECKYRFINNFIYEKTGRKFSDSEKFFKSINNMIENVGILSLSDNPLNNLMWFHYGDNHKGILIGISEFEPEQYKEVHYNSTNEIPKINLSSYNSVLKMYEDYNSFEIAFNDSSLQTALRTKTSEWKYESEWRGIKENMDYIPLMEL